MPDAKKKTSEAAVAAMTALLASHGDLLDALCSQADMARWGYARAGFVEQLARSAASRFKGEGKGTPRWDEVEAYLGTLHLEDLALGCGCKEGSEAAWEFFVRNYRGYLRRCAGAMLRRAAESPEARELADSLFAELYGVADGRRGAGSLFRYFHGRSSLKTWLRTVLAQRHVDSIRATRRFDSLDDEESAGRPAVAGGESNGERVQGNLREAASEQRVGPLSLAPDPYREKYIELFRAALQTALQSLEAADHRRVFLYYAEGKTLAEVGRVYGEHESSVSRNLERIRRELRERVEELLRAGEAPDKTREAVDKDGDGKGLSAAQIALCFQYATEDAPIDFDLIFPSEDRAGPRGLRKREPPRENR